MSLPYSFGSGEEDGEESFDDSDARRKLEEYKGSTAASASANRDQGNNRDGPSDSDENGAPQDEQDQAVEAAAEAAAAAGVTPYMQNGQVSMGLTLHFSSRCWYIVKEASWEKVENCRLGGVVLGQFELVTVFRNSVYIADEFIPRTRQT